MSAETADSVLVEVRMPREVVRRLDAYVAEDRARSRSAVVCEALGNELEAPRVVVRNGVADCSDEFDRLLPYLPSRWRDAAVDVRDTLHVAKVACRAEFGIPVSQEVVLQVALAILARSDAYAREALERE